MSVAGSSPVVDTRRPPPARCSTAPCSRHPVGRRFTDALYLAPGVSSGGAGRANPSMSGGTGLDNLYVVDGVNITNTGYGAVGSYSIIFGSLGNGTPFDFIKEIQVKTGGYEAEFGQSMGGVVNVVTKSGTQRPARRRCSATRSRRDSRRDWKTYQSRERHRATPSGTEPSDIGVEVGGPIIRNRLFFFGAINPAWEKRTFIGRPTGFPLRSLGEVDRERQITVLSGKGTYQMSPAATASTRRSSATRPRATWARSAPRRCSSTDTSSFSEIESTAATTRPCATTACSAPNWLLEAAFARASTRSARRPSVNDVARHRHHGRAEHHHRRHRLLRGRQRRASTCSTPPRRRSMSGGHQVKVGVSVRERRVLAGQPAHGSDVHRARRPQTATGRVDQHPPRSRPSAGSTA